MEVKLPDLVMVSFCILQGLATFVVSVDNPRVGVIAMLIFGAGLLILYLLGRLKKDPPVTATLSVGFVATFLGALCSIVERL